MKTASRKLIASLIATSMIAAPLPAMANDALIGGIVGGIVGGAIANSNKQRSTTTTRTYRAPAKKSYNSVARQTNRDTQTALNYFGFNAGTADGVMGRRSRAAVSAFQAHLGYAATGQLTTFERDFLMSSYYRAQSGGPNTAQLAATNPLGIRGLLIAWRDEAASGAMPGAIAGATQWGLPPKVAASVREIARSSDPTADQLVQRSGFIQLSDINGDGRTDYILDTSVTGSAFWCSAQSCAVRVFASIPEGYERNDFQAFNVTPAMFTCTRGTCSKSDQPVTQMAAAPTPMVPQPGAPTGPQSQMASVPAPMAAPVPSAQPVVQGGPAPAAVRAENGAVPDFFGGGTDEKSLQSHCNMVGLMASNNGGAVTEASMADPQLALSEQLCLTRSYAIAQGEALIAGLSNVTPAQVKAQCGGFGKSLSAQVAAVSVRDGDAVLEEVRQYVLKSGRAPMQMEKTAQVCLSAGYSADDLDTAMGSALVLVALGKSPYAELIGHHLSQGFGASERVDLALDWYDRALDALDNGATAVFAPAQPERSALLRKATAMLSGEGDAAAMPQPAASDGALPSFSFD